MGSSPSIFLKTGKGMIVEVAHGDDATLKKLGLNPKMLGGFKTISRELGEDTWSRTNMPMDAWKQGRTKISAKAAKHIMNSGKFITPAQRRQNNEFKDIVKKARASGLSLDIYRRTNGFGITPNNPTWGKRGRKNMTKDERKYGLDNIHYKVASERNRIRSEMAFSLQFTNKGVSPKDIQRVKSLDKKIAAIKREADKYGIQLDRV